MRQAIANHAWLAVRPRRLTVDFGVDLGVALAQFSHRHLVETGNLLLNARVHSGTSLVCGWC